MNTVGIEASPHAYGQTADSLFQPITLKSLSLANRVVMASMTRRFSLGGIPASDVADYYRPRAEGGIDLIIIEGT
jgi:2,4-dienoyl-CoA reductase-like NADH-dependent reductase (Old Yellow Enzyme family)